MNLYKVTFVRLFGEERLIIAKNFQDAATKAQKLAGEFEEKDEEKR